MSPHVAAIPPPSRRASWLAVAIVLVTAFQVALLAFRWPLVNSMEGWFWHFHMTPLDGLWLFLPAACVSVALALRLQGRTSRRWMAAAVLVLAGWIVQVSFALMEGRGLVSLQDRMVSTGHAAFAREALRTEGFLEVARNYEYLLEQHQLYAFNKTKPPGQLLVYWWTLRASEILDLFTSGIGRYTRLTIFASVAWPFMTYWVCLLMPLLGRELGHRASGFSAAALFVVVPNVTLMTLHLDQCLYPLLAAVPVALFLHATRTRARWAAGLAGASLYLGLYVSFSLLPLLPLLILHSILVRWDRARRPHGVKRGTAWEWGVGWAVFLAGFALADIAFRLFLDYDIARRFAGVMEAHIQWKHVTWTIPDILHYGLLDLAELLLWVGLPVVVLLGIRTVRAMKRAGGRRLRPSDALILATGATLLAMAFLGRTAAETGRLWLFMVPFLCLSAGEEITALGKSRGRALLWAAVFCELAVVLATKRFQDFH